ncbi:heavy-metal-associated domain-containing protein [Paractinoplanes hotanensis]|nr:heavy-metal-associated domain-containing protein [Actinoplanes hotanensis]
MCGSDTACACATTTAATEPATTPDGTRTVYQVAGMTGGGCAGRVSKQLTDVPGVRDVSVDVATGAVTVTSAAPLDDDSVAAAVAAAGYQLVR